MSVFESLNNTTDKAVDSAENYISSSKEYFKLKVFQQLTLTLSLAAKSAVIGGLLALALIFMSIAGAIALGDFLESSSLGFVAVGALLLLLALIAIGLKGSIDKKVITTLSKKFFE